jgi:hypothetical protein
MSLYRAVASLFQGVHADEDGPQLLLHAQVTLLLLVEPMGGSVRRGGRGRVVVVVVVVVLVVVVAMVMVVVALVVVVVVVAMVMVVVALVVVVAMVWWRYWCGTLIGWPRRLCHDSWSPGRWTTDTPPRLSACAPTATSPHVQNVLSFVSERSALASNPPPPVSVPLPPLLVTTASSAM